MSAFLVNLIQNRPIQGLTVESLVHLIEPSWTSKEALVQLCQYEPTVSAVRDLAVQMASNYGIKVDTSVHDLDFTQIKSDSELKTKLKES